MQVRQDGVVAASGESGARAAVFVWDTLTLETLARIILPSPPPGPLADPGVACLAFGAEGNALVTVGEDNNVTVWDLRSKQMTARGSAGKGRVLAVKTNRFEKKGLKINPRLDLIRGSLVVGTMAVKFWSSNFGTRGTQIGEEPLVGVHGSVGEEGTSQCAVCIESVTESTTVTLHPGAGMQGVHV
ncbi:hypothetical protein T484DRAFT_1768903 [Baffinella frigidus]|nr:hypothetical protein T484DRAFT_1768903 [Cryptophyta sp. CCMP2293]